MTEPTCTIKRLDESVINKIAAGEIIIQPANALKEMLENSIDAKATMIEILVKDGGLKLLQITDNGHGISKVDLPLLCERFATSKLSKFEDLESIATYGFRGEALASISHISRLSVITKQPDSKVAYKAYYMNGQLCSSNFKPSNTNVEPKPIAGKDGTQIIVEDLFYNIPSRLRGLKSKSDEFAKILDIVGRYAIHCETVGFSCKKYGDPLQQVNTRPSMPIKERIRVVYGSGIANELLEIDGISNGELGLVKVSGVMTNANYNNKKKIQPIFFINHRLVTCEPLKRAINAVFSYFLPKGSHSFYYLSLEIKPENLDVNVHPTKREVRFLNEDEIIDIIVSEIHTKLSSVDTSRKFKTQSIITKRRNSNEELEEHSLPKASQPSLKKYRQENKMVRVDASQSKLSSFMQSQPSSNYHDVMKKEFEYYSSSIVEDDTINTEQDIPEKESEEEPPNESNSILESPSKIATKIETNHLRQPVQVNLESIASLKNDLTLIIDKPLTNIFNNAVYVGIIDPLKRLCCFQYDVKLFLCDYAAVLLEFYYQIGLHEFCNFGEIEFDEPIKLIDILQPLYDKNDDLIPMDKVIDSVFLMKDMFREYFQIIIDNDKQLTTLPMLLVGVEPDFNKLPYLIYRLGAKINYGDEKDCLKGILRQIALFYLPEPTNDETKNNAFENQLESILFPEIKRQFLAPKNLLRDVIQIADLPGLYKVFERC
ncbi:DNA mismatch repair protein, putative [Candida dubliniensis CD36]|uniref:DNA mismatch repair protein, putative n=1 Tax=Candida dubliniensis (strain CD36 / ATCC MYA-646 / CBS 7987 / NCPF 3949 / NRRL Y-17841) TaxID=573826 RepID=B9WFF2_CANDC|nr:DNA mismatch repair protein, putative [Candida dubliniensis CD36]CAX41971.1 DNA mismatch repair protein, putative [Candida dubliniensis CD36]